MKIGRDEMEQEKTGYSTTTYKFRLYDRHLNWLKKTKILYNHVLAHYHQVILKNQELLELSNQQILRQLECMTVGTKEMKQKGEEALYPLDGFPKVPLYFRRAAINAAIGLTRSYVSRQKMLREDQKKKKVSELTTFTISPVYYKGMYKNFTDDSIMLKVYTGKEWKWICFPYKKDRNILIEMKCFSPTIKVDNTSAYLHMPVCKTVRDVRTIQERMKTEQKILAVSFPSHDCLAVGVVLWKDGTYEKSIFLRGGAVLKNKRKILYKKAEKIRNTSDMSTEKYYLKIEHLNEYYAHSISRKIVNYCLENQIKVIVVPNYEQRIDFTKRNYMKTNNFDWIGRRIIRYLKYKAFAEGIVVGTVKPYHITDVCSICGEYIKKYNQGYRPRKNYHGGQLYICPNGHRGNSFLNTAKNIGLHFLRFYS